MQARPFKSSMLFTLPCLSMYAGDAQITKRCAPRRQATKLGSDPEVSPQTIEYKQMVA